MTQAQQRAINRIINATIELDDFDECTPRVQRTLINYFNEELESFWVQVMYPV